MANERKKVLRDAHIRAQAFMEEERFRHMYGFHSAADVRRLVSLLQLPDPVITASGRHCSAYDAMLLVLLRLRGNIGTWRAYETEVGTSASAASELFCFMVRYISGEWGHLLDMDPVWMQANRRKYGKAIHRA